MGYIKVITNPLSNLLLAAWDIQVVFHVSFLLGRLISRGYVSSGRVSLLLEFLKNYSS